METKSATRRRRLEEYLASRRPAVVGDAEWAELIEFLAPISARELRRLLRDSAAPLTPFVEGVRQGNLDELERTLTALANEYAHGDQACRRRLRALVIQAKENARLAARRTKKEELRALKTEMVRWLLVWLEDPKIFATWAGLRRQAAGPGGPAPLTRG